MWDEFLQDVLLADYPGVEDSWLVIIGSQGESLLALDISSSSVSDEGLASLESCTSLQSLSLNSCDLISDEGLTMLTGTSSLCIPMVPSWETLGVRCWSLVVSSFVGDCLFFFYFSSNS